MSKHTTKISYAEAERGARLFVERFPTDGFEVRSAPADTIEAWHYCAYCIGRVLYVPQRVLLRSVASELALIVSAHLTWEHPISRRPSGGFRGVSTRYNILMKHARMILTEVMRADRTAASSDQST
jgi:hypothetical protein